MARSYQVNGETMVAVKGPAGSAISSLTNLGLSDSSINISLIYRHLDIQVNAWGEQVPPEMQCLLAEAQISMTLVHFDVEVLGECLRLCMGGGTSAGTFPHAGTLMGGGGARFAAVNNFVGLNLYSPIGNYPWRFLYSMLAGNPMVFPIGTHRSVVSLVWRAIPYTVDPWNAGLGANSPTVVLFDHVLDS